MISSRIYADVIGTELSHEIQKIQWVAYDDKMSYRIIVPKTDIRMNNLIVIALEIASGYAESFVSTLQLYSSVQFVRFGFCRLDSDQQAIFTHR